MTDPASYDDAPVSCRHERWFDEACDRFEADWKARQEPLIEEYLGQFTTAEPAKLKALLFELVLIDIEYRWSGADRQSANASAYYEDAVRHESPRPPSFPARPLLEDYASRYPQLGSLLDLPLVLIQHEYCVRNLHGARPLPGEYAKRFPGRADVARALQERPNQTTASDSTAADPNLAADRRQPSVPECFGRYRTRRFLGAGGMGAVFLADDPELGRLVAVKVPQFARRPDDQLDGRKRFLREARAAAAVRHPRVCPIYDVGEQDGVPYVVMAFIEGCSLAERLKRDGRFPDPQAAVALVVQVAEGLAAVHEAGLIHRDLKPANVLLDASGCAFLSDFGLARRLDAVDVLTAPGELVGTVSYMAPEQADTSGRFGPVTPRTDVYSLGTVLFQMLTGVLPFKAESNTALLYQIAHGIQPSPRQLRPDLDPALEKMVMKAMARQPKKRYADGRDFATALAGYLRQPTQSTVRLLSRRTRNGNRRFWWVSAGAVAIVVLLSLLPFFFRDDNDELPVRPSPLSSVADPRRHAGNGEPTIRISPQPGVSVIEGHANAVAFSPSGKLLAIGGDDRSVRIWDVATGKRQQRIPHDTEVKSLSFSPDEKTLAWGGADRAVTLWDLAKETKRTIAVGGPATTVWIRFAPDSNSMVTVGYGQQAAILWDIGSGKRLVGLEDGHTDFVNAAAFSPDSSKVATVSDDRTVRLWDAKTGKPGAPLKAHDRPVFCVAFSPNGERLATGSGDGTIVVWDVARGTAIKPEFEAGDGVNFVGWTRDERIVLKTFYDCVTVWDPSVNKSVVAREPKNKGPRVSVGKQYYAHIAITSDGRVLAYRDWYRTGDVHLLDLSKFIDVSQ
jgi:serine/threonine protein kinase